jgi:hypothetical protein
MKLIICLLALLSIFLALPLCAQDSQGFTVGYAYNQGSERPNQAFGTFDKQISGGLYSYNGTDISPYTEIVNDRTVLKFKIQAFTGLAYKIHDFGKFSLWTAGAGGVASIGETTTGLAKYDGFAHIVIKPGWGIVIGAEGTYSPLAGSDGIFRVGLRYGVK